MSHEGTPRSPDRDPHAFAVDGPSSLIGDQGRQPYPDPCACCGRAHLNGEHVIVYVPTPEPNGQRVAWEGCVDCWVKASNLSALLERAEKAERDALTAAGDALVETIALASPSTHQALATWRALRSPKGAGNGD